MKKILIKQIFIWKDFVSIKNNKGLKGINIISKFYENEPPKDICLDNVFL